MPAEKPQLVARALLARMPSILADDILEDREAQVLVGAQQETIVSLSSIDARFNRDSFYEAVVQAFDRPDRSPGGASLRDTDGNVWEASIYAHANGRSLRLAKDAASVLVGDFSTMSPKRDVREGAIHRLAATHVISKSAIRALSEVLADRPHTALEHIKLEQDVLLFPLAFLEATRQRFKEPSIELLALVPLNEVYYFRLAGDPVDAPNYSDYIERRLPALTDDALSAEPIAGLQRLLLLAAEEGWVTATLTAMVSPDHLATALDWALREGDPLARVGCIELAMNFAWDNPAMQSRVASLIQELLTSSVDEDASPWRTLSTLIGFSGGSLARSKKLSGFPVYWVRLCTFAHASLLFRALIRSSVDVSRFITYLDETDAPDTYYLQGLIDLQVEPRWLPDFASPSQLKSEAVSRAIKALDRYRTAHGEDDFFTRLNSDPVLMKFRADLTTWLPGPMEGKHGRAGELPEDLVTSITEALAQDMLRPKSFAALVNSALIYRVTREHAAMAAKALQKVKYQVLGDNDAPNMTPLLEGLAALAAASRSEELARDIRVLARATQQKGIVREVQRDIRLAFIAAAAFEAPEEWLQFAGEWIRGITYRVSATGEMAVLTDFLYRMACLRTDLWSVWGPCSMLAESTNT